MALYTDILSVADISYTSVFVIFDKDILFSDFLFVLAFHRSVCAKYMANSIASIITGEKTTIQKVAIL